MRLRIIEVEGDVDELRPMVQGLLSATGVLPALPALPPAAEQPAHVHHWKIDTPNGPTSGASCECGATRDFNSSHDTDGWAPAAAVETPAGGSPRGGKRVCAQCGGAGNSKVHRRQCLKRIP